MESVRRLVVEWRWFGLAAAVAVLWLCAQRYDAVSCDEDGACVILDRWTGKVGHSFTPLAADGLYSDADSREDSADVARVLREIGP